MLQKTCDLGDFPIIWEIIYLKIGFYVKYISGLIVHSDDRVDFYQFHQKSVLRYDVILWMLNFMLGITDVVRNNWK